MSRVRVRKGDNILKSEREKDQKIIKNHKRGTGQMKSTEKQKGNREK
jgi:hypothetical protein